MILLSHPTGTDFVRNALIALNDAGLLKEFWTCISWDDNALINRILPGNIRKEFGRRAFPIAIKRLTMTRPWVEYGRLLSNKIGASQLTIHESGLFCLDAVYRDLDKRVSKRLSGIKGVKLVYAYEDGALYTFRKAHELGLKRVYDLPIGYWRAAQAILQEEAMLEPEWADTMEGRLDSEEKLRRKDEEIALADTIIVPSNFTKETLSLAPGSKPSINVIPFGANPVSLSPKPVSGTKKLKVLFVGSLTQRKGLSYLLEAISDSAGIVDLTLIGSKPLCKCLPLEHALKIYKWLPPMPHERVLEEMRNHDILILPSIFEGFALVILEAMSQGIPVIITPNTGGGDIIKDGEDGFIIPIRSPHAISEKLELLYRKHDLLVSMSKAAYEKSVSWNWKRYRDDIIFTVKKLLE